MLYFITGDTKKVSDWFTNLATDKYFKIDSNTHISITREFIAYSCTQKDVENTIREEYERSNVILDPHTAVAKHIADRYANSSKPVLIAGTAHFAKFSETVMAALNLSETDNLHENFDKMKNMKSRIPFHKCLDEILSKPVIHKKIIDADLKEIKKAIVESLYKLKL